MTIVIVNTFYYPDIVGGTEVSVQKLAEGLAEKMRGIVTEDDYNDTYGRCRKCKGVLTIPIKVSDTQQWTMKLHNDGKGYSTITSVRGIVKPAF